MGLERRDATTLNELQVSVLTVLADASDVLYEGEIKAALWRSWSLDPTLRALRRRDFVDRGSCWSWQITDAGLIAIGRKPRRPILTVIEGGANVRAA